MLNTINKNYPDLLTVNELADLLRMSKISIYRMTESNQLPFYRFRGSLRFSRTDVDDFLKKKYRNASDI